MLKEESPFGGWYYPLLRAHEHVVPLARNLSTLCDSLSALREEPRRAAALAAAAQRFATAFLAPERVMGYVAALVRGYATLQRFRPRRHPMAKEWADAETVVCRPTAAATTDATVPSASSGRASGFPSSVAFYTRRRTCRAASAIHGRAVGDEDRDNMRPKVPPSWAFLNKLGRTSIVDILRVYKI